MTPALAALVALVVLVSLGVAYAVYRMRSVKPDAAKAPRAAPRPAGAAHPAPAQRHPVQQPKPAPLKPQMSPWSKQREMLMRNMKPHRAVDFGGVKKHRPHQRGR